MTTEFSLLLDGLGAMRSEYEKTVYGAANWIFCSVFLTDGRSVGVHVAATCDWTTPYRGNVLSAFPYESGAAPIQYG